jgi:hypothetical protein
VSHIPAPDTASPDQTGNHEQRQAYARRHTSSSPDGPTFAALYDSPWQIVSVSRPDPETRRISVITVRTNTGERYESRTDSEGDLRMGAAMWIQLGNCTRRTAASRVARQLADIPRPNRLG